MAKIFRASVGAAGAKVEISFKKVTKFLKKSLKTKKSLNFARLDVRIIFYFK